MLCTCLEWDTIHCIYIHSIYKTIESATIQVYKKIHSVSPTVATRVHWTNSVMFWHLASTINIQHHHAFGRCRSSIHTDHSSSSLNLICTGDSMNACETRHTLNHLVDTTWLNYHSIHLSKLSSLYYHCITQFALNNLANTFDSIYTADLQTAWCKLSTVAYTW